MYCKQNQKINQVKECTLVVGIDIGMVLCQDLVQVKMRNFSHFNLPKA